MATVRSGKTVEEIYLVLQERIVDGTYGPGVRMSQGGLASELDVSRTPLREALRRLEADGLLISTANRGMEVAPTSSADAEQFYAIRLLVEPPMIAAIIKELTDSDLRLMAAELESMRANRDRIADFQQAHMQFHEITLKRYPSAISELTHSLHLKIYRHQRLYLSRPHVPEDFTDVDELFLQAVHQRNEMLARKVMEFHLIDAALGLVLDSDPDHEFSSLDRALRGLGIGLDTEGDGRVVRPACIWWNRPDDLEELTLTTANLRCTPGGVPGSTQGDAT